MVPPSISDWLAAQSLFCRVPVAKHRPVQPSTHPVKAMRMPNLHAPKAVKFQQQTDGGRVASRHCRNSSDSPTADCGFTNPKQAMFWTSKLSRVRQRAQTAGPPKHLWAVRFKRLTRPQQALVPQLPARLAMRVPKVRGKAIDVEPSHRFGVVKCQIEGFAVYGL